MKTTSENNILIANFMGYDFNKDFGMFSIPFEQTEYNADSLKFHSDWNWLMEVVEKIESLGGQFKSYLWTEDEDVYNSGYWCIICDHFTQTQLVDSANIDDTFTKIEAYFNACIQFIQYHNSQKIN